MCAPLPRVQGCSGAAKAAVRLGLVAPPQSCAADGVPGEDVEPCEPLLADKHELKARAAHAHSPYCHMWERGS
jgi:hypothetical protein